MQFTHCPDPACDAVAEIVDRFALPSTDGYIEHVKMLCLHRHWFMLPVSALKPVPAPAPASRRNSVRVGRSGGKQRPDSDGVCAAPRLSR